MGQYIVEVVLKVRKEKPLTELYPSEEAAKDAIRSITQQVKDMEQMVVSPGGGMAFPYDQLAGISMRPLQSFGVKPR
jgi:hypothetical protein